MLPACIAPSGSPNETKNRDRGKPHGSAPPTPPDMRVRIRRFRDVSPEGPGVQCRLSP